MADLGVHIDCSLTFRDHDSEKINKAYNILGIIFHRDLRKHFALLVPYH